MTSNKMVQHVESVCQSCGGENPVWSADNSLFNKVNGSPNGIICPTCFVKKANELGINMFGIKPETSHEEVREAEGCLSCGVPVSQHGSCCGWVNANIIIFPWENIVNGIISDEEKELRWILSQQKNGLKIAAKLFPV